MGASAFCCPVWPQVYDEFVRSADHTAQVCDRLVQVDFDLIYVPEWSPVLYFVRCVVPCIEGWWCEYATFVDQWDNVLAILTLLHMPVRCIVEPQGGDDDDVVEDVGLNERMWPLLQLY